VTEKKIWATPIFMKSGQTTTKKKEEKGKEGGKTLAGKIEIGKEICFVVVGGWGVGGLNRGMNEKKLGED